MSLKLSNIYKGLSASTGLSTKALYGMTGALAGIAIGIAVYQQVKKYQEELYQATLDSALATKQAKDEINNYAETYSKLHKELNDANTSEERQAEIKKELLAIQTELNDKYGEEHGKLNLLTDSYRDQTDAIKDLNKELAQNWLNENENKSSFQKAERAMTKVDPYVLTTTDGIYDFESGGKILDIARMLKDEGHNIDIQELLSPDSFSISIDANATDAKKSLNVFMNEIRKIDGYQDDAILSNFNDTLSNNLISADKIINEHQELYDEILENKILADINLSDGFSRAISAVKEYNEALLSGDTSKIDEAGNALKQVEASIDTSSELWSPYKYKISDIFNQANTDRYDFKSSLGANQHLTESVIPTLRGKTASQAMNTNEFQELVKEAEKYKLSVDDVISVLREMGVVKKDIARIKDESYNPKSLKSQIVLLEEMSGKFSEIQKLQISFTEFGEEGLSNESMASFVKNFEGLDDSAFDKLFSTLKDAGATESDIQDAFNNFATEYIYSTDCLKGLTEATAEQTTKELELAGVQNAGILIQEALALQKAEAAWSSQDLTEATANELLQLAAEAGVTEESTNAFVNYIAQKMLAQYALDPSGDLTALQNVMNHLGLAGRAWTNYYNARAKIQEYQDSSQQYYDFGGGNIFTKEEMIAEQQAIMDKNQKEIEEEMKKTTDVDFKSNYVPPKAPKKPSGGSSKSRTEKKANEEQREHFNWLERKLAGIENKYKDINALVNDETKSFYAQDAAITNLIALNEEKKKVLDSQKAINEKDLNEAFESITDEKLQSSNFGITKAELITKVTEGGMDINEFILPENSSDDQKKAFDDLVESIKSAITAHDDLQKTEDDLEEAEEDTRKLQKERFQKRIAEIQAQNDALKSQQSTIESEINLLESIGGVVTADMYEELISLSQQQEEVYAKEAAAARDRLHEVDRGSEEYYQLKAQIQGCETSIIDCKTAQAKWNEEIKRLPVKKLQRYLELLGFIKEDLQNFMDEQAVLGIEGTKAQYQQLLDISTEQIEKLLEQQQLLKDLMKDYQFNSDKYNETASEMQDIDNEISSLIQSQHDWNQAILQIPINKLTEANDAMQSVVSAMDDIISGYDTAISSVVSVIDKEIDAINELKDAASDEYEERINHYQDQLDLLQKQNDERQLQLQLEQAQYDLERARGQKTTAVIRNGEMVYESDADAVRNAKEALQDVEYNKVINDLEKQITSLEDERDSLLESYDDQIDRLDTIKEKWSELTNEIRLAADAVKATEILGEGWQDKILSGNDSAMFESMKDMYSTIYNQQQQYQDQIASNERIAEMMNLFMEKFQNGSLTYEQAMSGIDNLIHSITDGFSSLEHLDALVNINGASDLNNLLSNMETTANASVNQFQDYMEIVKANADTMNKYTSTWEEMQRSIQEQIAELKRLYEESLKEKERRRTSSRSYSDSDDVEWGGTVTYGDGSVYSYDTDTYYDNWSDYEFIEKYHKGVNAGLVGMNGSLSKNLKSLQVISTKNLEPDEVPILAQRGEVVLTPEQMSKVIDNYGTAIDYGAFMTQLHSQNGISLSSPSFMEKNSGTDVTINMGNIELPDVRDVNGFAKAIGSQFRSLMHQEMTK